MAAYNVSIKWGKEKYDGVSLDTQQPVEQFTAQLFALTGVPPNRQKIMLKGKQLKTDIENWPPEVCKQLSNGSLLMLMGSAESLPTAPVSSTKFVEDMNEAQLASALHYPPGLKNMGNTCYMNASLQCLRAIEPIHKALITYRGSYLRPSSNSSDDDFNSNVSEGLTASLGALYRQMASPQTDVTNLLTQALLSRTSGRSGDSSTIIPLTFLNVLHHYFPRFAERDDHGQGYKQQDANEFWVELVRALQLQLKLQQPTASPSPQATATASASAIASNALSAVDTHLALKLTASWKCEDPADPEVTTSTETLYQLSCFIDKDVKYLHSGIKQGLEEKITKRSNKLERDAQFNKIARISRLPGYLIIQVVRFFYKEREQVSAKILKDVKFALNLDLFEFCDDALKSRLAKERERFKLVDDWVAENLRKGKEKEHDPESNVIKEGKPTSFPTSFVDDPGSNNSGHYDLQAVVTHHGRTSRSGHYVAWVRQANDSKVASSSSPSPEELRQLLSSSQPTDTWFKVDDDVVSPVKGEDILKLSGGGDHHCAYLLIYSSRQRFYPPGFDEEAALAAAASRYAALASTPGASKDKEAAKK